MESPPEIQSMMKQGALCHILTWQGPAATLPGAGIGKQAMPQSNIQGTRIETQPSVHARECTPQNMSARSLEMHARLAHQL